jgi:uncharacterized membrane protein YdjX (TVP38/TMEM64 family)
MLHQYGSCNQLNIYFFQVPNPLFDLAGIMCGQFGIPFWNFFLATLIGKAVIKAHIQVCIDLEFSGPLPPNLSFLCLSFALTTNLNL